MTTALITGITGFSGKLVFNTDKLDGTPQKLLDVNRLTRLGWKASIPLEIGIADTYEWYKETVISDG